jgi:hypothetical protein
VTVANMTFMGMNALHAAGGRGRLPIYQYLVEEVKMDIHKWTPLRVICNQSAVHAVDPFLILVMMNVRSPVGQFAWFEFTT